jgi:hypothetical protein
MNWLLGYGLDDWGSVPSRVIDVIFFLFTVASRLTVGPTNLLSSGYQGLSLRAKAAGA